ncbi:hypothetical protein TRVL_09535 [Trypanosoma vivax]|nr:hypothetical protein TRVL_09535 [Trypanosoma vivax]
MRRIGRVAPRCILRVFDYTLRTGPVATKWRKAIIDPLLKTETAQSSVASFRAVTLTSAMCKLMESIKACRVRCCDEDKLQPQRAGPKPKRSTLDTLMKTTRAVPRWKGGEKAAAVFIDYARAFFSVDHG